MSPRAQLVYYAPAPMGGGIKRLSASDVCLTSDICLSVAYIGPKSRPERSRKTKIGTKVAHVRHDSDTPCTVLLQLDL